MRFLVCDDNKMSAESISKLLNDLCSERSIDVTIDSFTDAGMFLKEDLQKYDAVFLDVMMDVPGIDVAEYIHKNSPDTIIVFISSYIEYAPEGYHVNAFRYILKSDLERTLNNCFDDLLNEISKRKRFITVRAEGEIENVPTDIIIYIQSDQRVLYFCLDRERRNVLRSYLKLSDIAEELESKGFIRIHKSFLVNLNYINHIDSKTVYLKTGQTFSMGDKYHDSAIRSYILWRGK